MDAVRVILALGLPWLLGTLWLNLLVPTAVRFRRALILGYGYLAGLFALTWLMRAVDALGLRLDFPTLLLVLLPLIGWAARLHRKRPPVCSRMPDLSDQSARLPHWQKLVAVTLLAIILVRLGGLWLEVSWRPLFPWDAFVHWATKAKVWTHLQSITPFVDYDAWLAAGGEAVYTDRHPDYPKTVPLIQAWMNLALGRWDEALMNLPWVPLLGAAALALFAQARSAEIGPLAALFFVYLLTSLPMVNLQVALAGYADIYLALFYLAAVMAFFQWARTGDGWQGLLAIAFALACPLLKHEGLFWSLSLLVGLGVLRLPRAWWLGLAVLGGVLMFALLFAWPRALAVTQHALAGLDLRWRPEALALLARSLFVAGSWHLLFWLLAALVVARAIIAWRTRLPWPKPLSSLGMSLASAVLLLCWLFGLTRYADGAVQSTALARVTLHLAPALLFFAMMLWHDLATQGAVEARRNQPAPGDPIDGG